MDGKDEALFEIAISALRAVQRNRDNQIPRHGDLIQLAIQRVRQTLIDIKTDEEIAERRRAIALPLRSSL